MSSVTETKFIIKGTFIDTLTKDEKQKKKGFILVEDGLIKNFSEENPDTSIKLYDYTGKLIIPGLSDLHLHAPQYPNIGLGLDLELLDWLDTYTFPEESKYKDIEYAKSLKDSTGAYRHQTKRQFILRSGDGVKFVVSNQWSTVNVMNLVEFIQRQSWDLKIKKDE